MDDVVGLLLDLDTGSLTVYKNGDRLGVMVAEGLSGPVANCNIIADFLWNFLLNMQR